MKVAIFGAGSVGCYLGALLSLAKIETHLICRPRIKQAIVDNGGIKITDYQGLHQRVMPAELLTTPESDQNYDIVFVTLKCHQLAETADDFITLCSDKTQLIFMQNGLGSFEQLMPKLGGLNISQGITPFNVLQKQGATFHKGTEGDFTLQESPSTQSIKQALNQIGSDCHLYPEMQPVIAGKLLLNLNNALNAIADQPIKQELENKALRSVLASAMNEWMAVASAMELPLTQFTQVKPQMLPKILKLPNWLFKLAAKKMLAIDPQARSSMWEDLQAGRKTEIEYLNGAVEKLGSQHQIATPVNAQITRAIHSIEAGEAISLTKFLQSIK